MYCRIEIMGVLDRLCVIAEECLYGMSAMFLARSDGT